MGFRETINKYRVVTSIIAGVVIVGTAGAILFRVNSTPPTGPAHAFYTDDDGQSYFTDRPGRFVPFDHGGKQAVRAHVYCYPGDRPFVAYMERWAPQVQDQARELTEKLDADITKLRPGHPAPPDLQSLGLQLMQLRKTSMEFKKPGPGNQWITAPSDAQIHKLVDKRPGGSLPAPVVAK